MNPRKWGPLAPCLAAALTLGAGAAPAAQAKPSVKITAKPAVVDVGAGASVSGRVRGARGKLKVQLQEKRGRVFKNLRGAKLQRGRFRIKWVAPAVAGKRTLRVRVLKRRRVLATSRSWRVVVRARPIAPPVPPPAPAPAPAAPRTQVIDPGSVVAVPAPGADGDVVLGGVFDVKPGDVLAMGIGDATPYGFLGKATAVRVEGGRTIVTTTPAALQDALPEGEFSQTLDAEEIDTYEAPARRASRSGSSSSGDGGAITQRVNTTIKCSSEASVEVTGNVGIYPSIEFDAGWGPFKGTHARLVGKAEASAELAAKADAEAECSVGPHELFNRTLKPIAFSVGPVPVVLVPKITVKLSAEGSVEGQVDAEIHGSITAKAGIEYKDGDFHPISGFEKNWGYSPPVPSGAAHLGATISPQLDVMLYGVAGPQMVFNTGLAVDATPFPAEGEPSWTLTAPVSLTAKLAIPALKISSPELTVFEHTFLIAKDGDDPVQGFITFDDQPIGTTITDQYQSLGVVFDSAVFITDDGANPTSPVLSGSPRFQGPIVGHFVDPATGAPTTVNTLQLDAGYIDNPGSVEIVATLANGSTRVAIADRLGIDQISISARGIKSFSAQAVSEEDAGFAIDNLGFSR